RFVGEVRDAGCDAVIVHARKAVLGGLSAQDNREIPPLKYDVVSELKRGFPDLQVVVNGGLREPHAILAALDDLDGIMLGREAYHRPIVLSRLDALVFGAPRASIAETSRGNTDPAREVSEARTRARVIERMRGYTE